jgi:transcriptional regulator with XRE-family HTH domain
MSVARLPRMNIDGVIGHRVMQLRMNANLSMFEAARIAHVPLAIYAAGERGEYRFRAEQLFNIANVLDVKLKDIMSALE